MGIKVPGPEPHFEHPAQLTIGKLRDADATLLRAEQIWQGYLASTSRRLEPIKDEAEHAVVTVVRLGAPAPIEELTALLRTCVNDGRSALDNLIDRLALDHGATDQQVKQAAFVVAKTEQEWNKSRRARLGALPAETVDRIRDIQPFASTEPPGPSHPLAVLHDLWLADKHRTSFSAGIGFSPQGRSFHLGTLKMTVPNAHRDKITASSSDVDQVVDLDVGPIVDGTRLVITRLPEEVDLKDVEVESVNATFTLGIVGPGVRITDSAIALLRNALRFARESVRYIVGGLDTPPVAFTPGLIQRYDEIE